MPIYIGRDVVGSKCLSPSANRQKMFHRAGSHSPLRLIRLELQPNRDRFRAAEKAPTLLRGGGTADAESPQKPGFGTKPPAS